MNPLLVCLTTVALSLRHSHTVWWVSRPLRQWWQCLFPHKSCPVVALSCVHITGVLWPKVMILHLAMLNPMSHLLAHSVKLLTAICSFCIFLYSMLSMIAPSWCHQWTYLSLLPLSPLFPSRWKRPEIVCYPAALLTIHPVAKLWRTAKLTRTALLVKFGYT